MKVYTGSEATTERIAPKMPLLSEFVRKYRGMTKARSLIESTVETKPVSLSTEERYTDVKEFYKLYEEFVESLCDGAQFGISPKIEEKYRTVRRELVHRYSSLRPFLSAFLRPSGEDAKYAAQGIKFDAFDALLEQPTLDLFLSSDDGNTISRITRTREALMLYGEHMRQIVKKTK